MDFLENIALPQSLHHIELLSYIIILTLVILLPYLAILFGSTLLAIMFNKKGRTYNNNIYIKFSKDLIDLVTLNISSAIALGIIPIFTIALIFAQLMQGSGSDVTEDIIFSMFLFLSAIIAIYTFKGSFKFSSVIKLCSSTTVRDESVKENFDFYKNISSKFIINSGLYGLILLSVSIYLFIGAFHFAANSLRWGGEVSISELLFSTEAIISFISFASFSLVVTTVALLYKLFKPNSRNAKSNNDYTNYVKKFSLNTAIIFTLTQPILLTIGLMSIPKVALNDSLFLITVFILFFLFVLSIMFYFMIKESHLKYRNKALFIMLIIFLLVSIKEEAAFSTSSQLHNKKLAANYIEYQTAFKEKLGVNIETISGEDIFTGRCAACHSFDTKIVGPPYNETLVKYEGNLDGLVEFIYNPQKINSEYPPMPNQGLKKSEASSVAEYIVKVYNEKSK